MDGEALRSKIRERFPDAVVSEHDFRGDQTLVLSASVLHDALKFVRDEPGLELDLLCTVCGVDYPERALRFEVVYHLMSVKHRHRLRLRFPVSEESSMVDSVTDLFPTANWFEREVFDMIGIRFKGHPNLRRILTHEGFEGHPLRKDYPVNRRTVIRPPVADILTPKPFNG